MISKSAKWERAMSFRVEYLYQNSNCWTASGSFASEQTAIFNAKSVAKRTGVSKVRVSNKSGSAVWMA